VITSERTLAVFALRSAGALESTRCRDLLRQDDEGFTAVFGILVMQYMGRWLRAALLDRIGAGVVFALARQAAAAV
jgi:hypothetical protein